MNLQELFSKQAELDAHIEQEHPRQPGEDRLSKKVLALQVELGELANEWRGFKFWSKDQEPRTRERVLIQVFEDDEPYYSYETKNPLLEEYVDGLHFFLSVGLELDITPIYVDESFKNDITKLFVNINSGVSTLLYPESVKDMNYLNAFANFIRLGQLLGFACEEVEQAYDAKHQINFERQANGY